MRFKCTQTSKEEKLFIHLSETLVNMIPVYERHNLSSQLALYSERNSLYQLEYANFLNFTRDQCFFDSAHNPVSKILVFQKSAKDYIQPLTDFHSGLILQIYLNSLDLSLRGWLITVLASFV